MIATSHIAVGAGETCWIGTGNIAWYMRPEPVSSQTSAETHRARSPAAVVVALTQRRSITNIPHKSTVYRKYLLKIHTHVLI